MTLRDILYSIYSFFIMGHNFVGTISFCGSLLFVALYFVKHYTDGNRYDVLFQFPIAWGAVMPFFHIMDAVSIPFNLYLYGIDPYLVSHWVDPYYYLQFIPYFAVLYFVRDRVNWKNAKRVTLQWFMFAFYTMVVFGTVGLTTPPGFDIVKYWVFSYIPLWVLWFWNITLIFRRSRNV